MHLYTCAQDDCLCKSTKPSANHIGQLPIGSPTANQASTFRKWKPASTLWVSVTAPAPHLPRRITASGNTHHHYHHQYYHCYCWQSYLDPQLTRYHNRGGKPCHGNLGLAIIVTRDTPTDKAFVLTWAGISANGVFPRMAFMMPGRLTKSSILNDMNRNTSARYAH